MPITPVVLQSHQSYFLLFPVVKCQLYANLLWILQYTDTSLCAAASYQMLQLTLKNGLCAISLLALSFYGETQAAIGNLDLACRLGMDMALVDSQCFQGIIHSHTAYFSLDYADKIGGLAMKLLERKDSSRYKASAIVTVGCVAVSDFMCSDALSSFQASVIITVYQLIYWSSTPLQSIVDAHNLGYKSIYDVYARLKLIFFSFND